MPAARRRRAASARRRTAAGEARADAAGDGDASGSDASAAQTDTQIADDPASAPQDASPETLPFTGLQLALPALVGLAIAASGTVMRRAM